MKLSDIVKYLNHLGTLSVKDAMVESMKEVTKITHAVQHSEIQIDQHAATLISIQQDLEESLKKYEQELKKLREQVQIMIEKHEPTYFAFSNEHYEHGMRYDTPKFILERKNTIDDETEKLLIDRVITYTSWQYPGMVLRPAHSPGIESLVPLDPLYLVDTDRDLLSPIQSLFTPEYQRRLRYYVIDEHISTKIFVNLPQEQFGFVYAFYYFDFKPLEIIQKYLDEVWLLLRPGGTFLFSFNDCDQWSAVGSAENHFYCYTPGRVIRQYIQKTGYEIVHTHATSSGISWIEIRKPGVLNSIRGAQALASILRKSDPIIKQPEPEVVDIPVQQLYNELDLDMLIELARVLNVDISEAKTKREFNIKKVRRTISAHLESANYSEEYLRQLFKKEKP